MIEIRVSLPEDIEIELNKIPKENWQILFSRLLKEKLEEIKEMETILSKSKLTESKAKELADEISLSIAKRLTEEK